MTTLDFEQNPAYPQWAANLLDINRGYFGNCSTIAVWNKQKLCTVVVYSSFNGINCEVTVASTNKWWLRKDILKILFKYPFEDLGCRRLTLLIKKDNELVRRTCEKCGFLHEGTLRKFYNDGSDCMIYGILHGDKMLWA